MGPASTVQWYSPVGRAAPGNLPIAIALGGSLPILPKGPISTRVVNLLPSDAEDEVAEERKGRGMRSPSGRWTSRSAAEHLEDRAEGRARLRSLRAAGGSYRVGGGGLRARSRPVHRSPSPKRRPSRCGGAERPRRCLAGGPITGGAPEEQRECSIFLSVEPARLRIFKELRDLPICRAPSSGYSTVGHHRGR